MMECHPINTPGIQPLAVTHSTMIAFEVAASSGVLSTVDLTGDFATVADAGAS